VSNVVFANNTVYLKSVGFYVVPFVAKSTAASIIPPPAPADLLGGGGDWPAVRQSIASSNTGIVVENNTFLVDLDPSESLQGATYMHSGMKLHYTSGMIVRGNTFRQAYTPDGGVPKDNCTAFNAGAAVNVAAGNLGMLVTGNVFEFDPFSVSGTCSQATLGHQAVYLGVSFQMHPFYGIGAEQIFAPDQRITISGNTFTNSRVKLDDVCDNTWRSSTGSTLPLDGGTPGQVTLATDDGGRPYFTPFCQNMDTSSSAFVDDGIVVTDDNVFQGAKTGVVLKSVVESASLAPYEPDGGVQPDRLTPRVKPPVIRDAASD
jgi:hypothetical protein